MNLQPEIDHIIEIANSQIYNSRNDDITNEYTELIVKLINKNIIKKYRLNEKDIKFIENYLKKQEPDYFLLGLTGKDIKEKEYSKRLWYLLVQINNTYISEKRNHRISFWSLITAIVSIAIATLSLAVSILQTQESTNNLPLTDSNRELEQFILQSP